jgi:hypothetical protein
VVEVNLENISKSLERPRFGDDNLGLTTPYNSSTKTWSDHCKQAFTVRCTLTLLALTSHKVDHRLIKLAYILHLIVLHHFLLLERAPRCRVYS